VGSRSRPISLRGHYFQDCAVLVGQMPEMSAGRTCDPENPGVPESDRPRRSQYAARPTNCPTRPDDGLANRDRARELFENRPNDLTIRPRTIKTAPPAAFSSVLSRTFALRVERGFVRKER